jgi:hypothetical protein
MFPVDAVQRELVARGLPNSYLLRVRGELAAHIEDAVSDLIKAGHPIAAARSMALERFGDPSILAAAFFDRYRRSSFILRHPVAVSLAGPPLLFIFLGIAHLVIFALLYGYFSSWWFQIAQHIGQALVSLAGAILAVLLLGRRLGHRRWPALAALMFLIVGVTSDLSVRPRPDGDLAISMYVARWLWRPPYYLFFLRGISTRTPSGSISFHMWNWHKRAPSLEAK